MKISCYFNCVRIALGVACFFAWSAASPLHSALFAQVAAHQLVAAQDDQPPEVTPEEAAAAAKEAEAVRQEIEAENAKAEAAAAQFKTAAKPIELSKDLKKLAENLYIDAKNKLVVLEGTVVLRVGPPLEMFACLKGTKEHESVVSVGVKAFQVHGALLAIGAKQGTPVQFAPEYKAATGQQIDIHILWKDRAGKEHQALAQEWIRDRKTKQQMTHPFVFAGSGFWQDEETGQKYYMAEGGELICVSNFSSALLDLPVESSQATEGLLFEAFTDRIPPEGTPIKLVLIPKKAAKDGDAKDEATKGEATKGEATKGEKDKTANDAVKDANSTPPKESLDKQEQ